GSLTLTLYDVMTVTDGPITPGGAPVIVSIPTPGQTAHLTFSGTTGQRISVLGSSWRADHDYLNDCDVTVTIFDPAGTELKWPVCAESAAFGGGFIDAVTLQATGTYTIRVTPKSTVSGRLTVRFTAPIPVGGAEPEDRDPARPGGRGAGADRASGSGTPPVRDAGADAGSRLALRGVPRRRPRHRRHLIPDQRVTFGWQCDK